MRSLTGSRWQRIVTGVTAAAVVVIVAGVTWIRMLPVTRDTIWADDSTRFLGETIRLGLAHSLFVPYGGYQQFLPRVAGWVALHLGAFADLARHTTEVAVVVAGLLGALVFVLSRQFVGSYAVRVLIGVASAFVPSITAETAGNLANLHWYVLAATPFLFAFVPRSWRSSAALAAVAVVFTLSETQTTVFLPLLALGWRDRKKLPVIVAAVLGLVAQLVSLNLSPRIFHGHDTVTILDIVLGYLVQPFAGTWTNDSARVGELVTGVGWWTVVVPFLVVAGVVAFALWRGRRPQRIMLGAMVYGSAVSWAAPVLLTPQPRFQFTKYTVDTYGGFHVLRYTAIASLFIVLGLLIVCDILLTRRLGRVLAAVVVAALIATAVANWTVPWSARMAGPAWTPQIPAAERFCAHANPATPVQIQVAPSSTWALIAPCTYLQR